MFSFMERVGDHRSWIVEFTTRSVLGVNLIKIQRSIARRLVSTNKKAVSNYNAMVEKLFCEHDIVGRMRDLIAKADLYGFPGPDWLEKKITRLHIEMDQLRMRANDKCRKILTPVAPCGPEIRHWGKMIHMYQALLKIKRHPGKKWNQNHTYRVGYSKGLGNTELLSEEQILDGLCFSRIKMLEARKRATPDRE